MAVARAAPPHQAVKRWLLLPLLGAAVSAVVIGEASASVASMRTLKHRETERELKRLRAVTPPLSVSLSLSLSGDMVSVSPQMRSMFQTNNKRPRT